MHNIFGCSGGHFVRAATIVGTGVVLCGESYKIRFLHLHYCLFPKRVLKAEPYLFLQPVVELTMRVKKT